jgi:Heterokaryon incompatibility protein (HET)
MSVIDAMDGFNQGNNMLTSNAPVPILRPPHRNPDDFHFLDNHQQRKRVSDTLHDDTMRINRPRLGFSTESLPESVSGDICLPQPSGNLCSPCLGIDFNTILSSEQSNLYRDRGINTRIPVLQDGSTSECDLCHFFDEIKWEPLEDKTDGKPISYELASGDKLYKKCHRLAVVPSHIDNFDLFSMDYSRFKTGRKVFFVRGNSQSSSQILARVLQLNAVDFDQVQSWLDFCSSHHTELCKKNRPIPRITVIDCKLRQLATIDSSDSYATLSYVWGRSPLISEAEHGRLPETMERTIEDSMTVVTTLGIQYLWVDRYCIPQDNSAEKHSQIRRMGDIYENSILTIIAAAGDSPDFGLPGVSQRARKQYPLIQLRSLTLATLPPAIEQEVLASAWNTRGWTYQEGLLACRRLIFTESQVYFQCAAMHCQEAVLIPLSSLHIKSLERFRDEFPGFFPRNGIGKRPEEIIHRISEYAGRQLSYPSDTLYAFQGILRAYQSFKTPVHHLCGVVIFPPETFKHTLNMTITEMFAFGLSWMTTDLATRRPEFPSWSWCGWQFIKAFPSITLEWVFRPVKFQFEVLFTAAVEATPGDLRQLEHTVWFKFPEQIEKSFPDVLILQAWTFEVDPNGDSPLPRAMSISSLHDWAYRPNLERRLGHRMKDLHASLVQAFERAGFHYTKDNKHAVQFEAVVLGKEQGRVWATFHILFLRWSPSRQVFERLPVTGWVLAPIGTDQVDNGYLGELKLTRRQIRLG